MASNSEETSRATLVERVLPQMKYSTSSNPLTAPLLMNGLTTAERIARRFAIDGVSIVTGGSGNIGLSICRAILEHGSSGLAIFDIPASLESSAADIRDLQTDFPNAKVVTKTVDVTDEKRVLEAVDEVVNELGSVNNLACLAGIVSAISASSMSPASFRKVIDVNLTGSFLVAQAVANKMISAHTGGSIVLTASISGHYVNFPQPQVSYNVSKAGVLHMTRSLAAEWAQYGIRVNSISPGYMNTILNEGEGLAEGRRIWNEHCAFGRMGEPEELTGAMVLLLSKVGGRYMTGEDICVDGGQTLS